MSKDSVDSTVDERNVGSSKISKYLKMLFCCFKRERLYEEEIGDSEEFDYVVEKLVVKRVPLALFAMSADFQNRRRRDVSAVSSDISQSTFSSTFDGNNPAVNAIKTATDKITHDPVGNKTLHLTDRNRNQNFVRKRRVHFLFENKFADCCKRWLIIPNSSIINFFFIFLFFKSIVINITIYYIIIFFLCLYI